MQALARYQELGALVKEAATNGKQHSLWKRAPVMRPLQMLRLSSKDAKCMSLRRASVAATDGVLGRSSDFTLHLERSG